MKLQEQFGHKEGVIKVKDEEALRMCSKAENQSKNGLNFELNFEVESEQSDIKVLKIEEKVAGTRKKSNKTGDGAKCEAESTKNIDYTCNVCKKRFTKKYNLQRHLVEIHEIGGTRTGFVCEQCGKSFTQKASVDKHIKRSHSNANNRTRREFYVSCSACGFTSVKKLVREHFSEKHNIDITEEKIQFQNFEEFEKWKEEFEKQTVSRFSKICIKKQCNRVIHYYRCHRDGFYQSKGKNIRNLKSAGSNRINGYCPAKMNAIVLNDGTVTVSLLKSHVGHKMELQRLPLQRSEKQQIVEQLCNNIPFDEVLSKVKESVTEKSTERLHLLTRKDLYNIEQTFNLRDNIRYDEENCAEVVEARDDDCSEMVEAGDDQLETEHVLELHTVQIEVENLKTEMRDRFLELIGTITTIEECEVMKQLLAPISPSLEALRNVPKDVIPKLEPERKKTFVRRKLKSVKNKINKIEKQEHSYTPPDKEEKTYYYLLSA